MPWAYTPMVDKNLGGTPFGNWMKANLRPEQVAASIAFMLHEDCPVTGQMISCAGGRVTRIFFASPDGYLNPDLTPEDVRDNWAAVEGAANGDGRVPDALEIASQAREFEIISKMLNAPL